MAAIKIEKFGGQLPAWDDHLLPDGQAATAVNGYLFSGALQGWRKPKLLRNLTNSAAKFAYRVPTITKATAFAYLVLISQPTAGDTFTLGENTYKFVSALANPNDVLIGATVADTVTNVVSALTGLPSSAIGTTVGEGTSPNASVDQTAGAITTGVNGLGNWVRTPAPDFGAAYNTTAVAESTAGARLTWLFDLASLADTTTTLRGGLNSSFDSAIAGAATWLEFVDPETTVMRSPIVDDQFDRYYMASPSLPPKYNTHDRITAGSPAWLLGVPAPGCAPVVTVSGGGDSAQLGVLATTTFFAPQTVLANTIRLQKIRPPGAMSLNDASWVPETTDPDIGWVMLLFDDAGNVPGKLLNVSNPQVGTAADTEANSPFLNPTGLLANTDYWIGVFVNTTTSIKQGGSALTGWTGVSTFSNGPPAEAPNGASAQVEVQIWGNLSTQNVIESRAYVYTWVTAYNEEGPPSAPTLLDGWSNGLWTIGLWKPADDDMGVLRNIKKINIYRTVTAVGGTTTFFFVATVDVGVASYLDTLDDSVVATTNQLASTTWFPPPPGLQAIHSMPNGIAVGFKGNEVWFSEPYRPHAWPPQYVMTTEFPVVGIGITMQSCVVCTSGRPYVLTGVNPSVMTSNTVPLPEPCLSRDSIVGSDQGVFYQSPNGLILVTQDGRGSNMTESWITREKWALLTPKKFAAAVSFASCYFCFGAVRDGDNTFARAGFAIELSSDAQSFSIWPQPGGHRLGFIQLQSPNGFDIDNVLIDPWTGICLLVQNNAIYYYDFQDQSPEMSVHTWRSKKYQHKSKKNYEVCKVYFSVPTNTPAQNAVRNTAGTLDASWNTLGTGQYGILRVFCDDVLVTCREIVSSGEVLRILDGFKGEDWQFEITARVLVSNFQVATTMRELGAV